MQLLDRMISAQVSSGPLKWEVLWRSSSHRCWTVWQRAFGMLRDSTKAVARELNVCFSAISRLQELFRGLGRKRFCANCHEPSQGCSTSPSGTDASQRSGSVATDGGGRVMVCYGQSGLNLSQNTLDHVPCTSDVGSVMFSSDLS